MNKKKKIWLVSYFIIFIITINTFFLYLFYPVMSFYIVSYKYYTSSKGTITQADFQQITKIEKAKKEKTKKEKTKEKIATKKETLIEKIRKKVYNKKDIIKKTQDIEKKEIPLYQQFPLTEMAMYGTKIIIRNFSNNIKYKDINKNIQKDLWTYAVISSFYWTPILFTHSSWWKYNFGVYYLFLKKDDVAYIKVKYQWNYFFLKLKVKEIYKNIPWYDLYGALTKINKITSVPKHSRLLLDTCEKNWRKRRVIVTEITNVIPL